MHRVVGNIAGHVVVGVDLKSSDANTLLESKQ